MSAIDQIREMLEAIKAAPPDSIEAKLEELRGLAVSIRAEPVSLMDGTLMIYPSLTANERDLIVLCIEAMDAMISMLVNGNITFSEG